MRRNEEAKLLKPCREWLEKFLREKHRRATITLLSKTDRQQLRYSLNAIGLMERFPDSTAWEVKVDVAAVLEQRGKSDLVFVELKANAITLRDVGQLLGYCRICRPISAFLLSPKGPSADLERLLKTYGRTDVLAFGSTTIRVGRWNLQQKGPDWGTLIPSGELPATLA